MAPVQIPRTYAARILRILTERGFTKTACPSEILPMHLKQNSSAMNKVRAAAEKLKTEGKIEILRGGKPVRPGSKGPIRLRLKSRPQKFDYGLNFKRIDFRKKPELYRIGKGEQGVLLVEPYKSEILPYWRFKTPEIAEASAKKIYSIFLRYEKKRDFVGMDMARKFLQMGVTRSRRYANHRSGKKYIGDVPKAKRGQSGPHGRKEREIDFDPIKAESAERFITYLNKVKKRTIYQTWYLQNKKTK